MAALDIFFQYQREWISDKSQYKILEKSRRIGATWAEAFCACLHASKKNGSDVWFSSADETAAKEFIRYVALWAKTLKIISRDQNIPEVSGESRVLMMEFASGHFVHALSSNPNALRSKGGYLIWDEAAHHKNQDAMWAAAEPVAMWGYPLRILSTHLGKGGLFYLLVDAAKQGKNSFSLHTIDIHRALRDGLLDRILGRKATAEETEQWLKEKQRNIGNDRFQQEYCCMPIDSATAWLPWDVIIPCESLDAGNPKLYTGEACYVGMDIARHRHLTVIWVLEKLGDVLFTREVISMRNAEFAVQDAALDSVMNRYHVVRVCVDRTGMGEKSAEDYRKRYGFIVEGIQFTSATKTNMANAGKRLFEDRRIRIPAETHIRESFHSVARIVTPAGNIRFDAESTEHGHADEFWACMLAVWATEGAINYVPGVVIEPLMQKTMRQPFSNRNKGNEW